jgi:hypothetical protein
MGIVERIRKKQELKRELIKDSNLNLTHYEIASMELSAFATRDIAIEIHSEVLGSNVWFCPDDAMTNQVKSDNRQAVTYTVSELKELIQSSPTPEEIKRIHDAKVVFPGSTIVESEA